MQTHLPNQSSRCRETQTGHLSNRRRLLPQGNSTNTDMQTSRAHFAPALLVQTGVGDQNDDAIKLDSIDGQTNATKKKCLRKCMKYQDQTNKTVTGCEVIWSQIDRGCYGKLAEGRVSSRCVSVCVAAFMACVSIRQPTPAKDIAATGWRNTHVGFSAIARKTL